MNNGLAEAYLEACQEHQRAWNFFDQAEPEQVDESVFRLNQAEQRVARLKRELEKEMGQPA